MAKLRLVRGEALPGGVRRCQAKDDSIGHFSVSFARHPSDHSRIQEHKYTTLFMVWMCFTTVKYIMDVGNTCHISDSTRYMISNVLYLIAVSFDKGTFHKVNPL